MIKVVGIVNGTPDFRGHGKVINGTSDLLVEVLGDREVLLMALGCLPEQTRAVVLLRTVQATPAGKSRN